MHTKLIFGFLAVLALTSCASQPIPEISVSPSTSASVTQEASQAPEPSDAATETSDEITPENWLDESELLVFSKYFDKYPLVDPDYEYQLFDLVRFEQTVAGICELYDSGIEGKFLVASPFVQVVEVLPNFKKKMDSLKMTYFLIDSTVKNICPEYKDLLEIGEY